MTNWYVSKVQCNICTNEEVAVYPKEADEEQLECPSCGAQDSNILARIEPGGNIRELVHGRPITFYETEE